MPQISAYLTFNGNCREAMTFYKECLGGELTLQTIAGSSVEKEMPVEAKSNILHASLTKDDLVLLGSDILGPGGLVHGNTISLSLNCGSEEEINTFFSRLSAGGQVACPLSVAFWGGTFGTLIDKFGNNWLLNYDKQPENYTITEPKLEERSAQSYVAVRTQATMQELGTAIAQGLEDVFAWLRKQSVAPSGAPFIRYLVIDMAAKLDIELGVPVTPALAGEGRIFAGVLPAGRYAALVYTGLDAGIKANGALLEWGAKQGFVWDKWTTENGDGFGGRVESFLTDPDEEPDRARWKTEVAIRLADNQS